MIYTLAMHEANDQRTMIDQWTRNVLRSQFLDDHGGDIVWIETLDDHTIRYCRVHHFGGFTVHRRDQCPEGRVLGVVESEDVCQFVRDVSVPVAFPADQVSAGALGAVDVPGGRIHVVEDGTRPPDAGTGR